MLSKIKDEILKIFCLYKPEWYNPNCTCPSCFRVRSCVYKDLIPCTGVIEQPVQPPTPKTTSEKFQELVKEKEADKSKKDWEDLHEYIPKEIIIYESGK